MADVSSVLQKLKDTVEKEKLRLDYIAQGAQLLADMLLAEEQDGKRQQQRSESGVAAATENAADSSLS